MSKILIIKLILYYASINGLDGNTALSIAKIESGLNPNAIGQAGEIGIFQLKQSCFPLYTKKQLQDPILNIKVGIEHLLFLKNKSNLKQNNQWIIAHNVGLTGSKRILYPEKFPYKVKFNLAMKEL